MNQSNQIQKKEGKRAAASHCKFTPREDEMLKEAVEKFHKNWAQIAQALGNRTARQCRDRWNYYLCPDTNLEEFSPEDDQRLLNLFTQFGNKWSLIAPHFEGRTSACVRNRCLKLQRHLQKCSSNKIYEDPKCNNLVKKQEKVFSLHFMPVDCQQQTVKKALPNIFSFDQIFLQQKNQPLSFISFNGI